MFDTLLEVISRFLTRISVQPLGVKVIKLCFSGDIASDLKFKFYSAICVSAINLDSIQPKLVISNLDNVCIDGCRCNEVVPDVDGVKLDIIVERATQVTL